MALQKDDVARVNPSHEKNTCIGKGIVDCYNHLHLSMNSYSFDKYLLSANYMLVTYVSIGDIVGYKTKSLPPGCLHSSEEEIF